MKGNSYNSLLLSERYMDNSRRFTEEVGARLARGETPNIRQMYEKCREGLVFDETVYFLMCVVNDRMLRDKRFDPFTLQAHGVRETGGIEIDANIVPLLQVLNANGFLTIGSCGGHEGEKEAFVNVEPLSPAAFALFCAVLEILVASQVVSFEVVDYDEAFFGKQHLEISILGSTKAMIDANMNKFERVFKEFTKATLPRGTKGKIDGV